MIKYIKTLVFFNILIINLLLITVCAAQKPKRFDHISTNEGLSQSDVNCIFQDKHGFMWFGTHDGLNRYDGYKFTIFKMDPNNKFSISSNLIWNIIDDKKGNLWVGTTGFGLNYFDLATEKFRSFKHNEKDKNSLSSDIVKASLIDSKNQLWVGTDKGVDMANLAVSLDSIKFQSFVPVKDDVDLVQTNNSVNVIFEDSNQRIWVGTNKGVYSIVKDKNKKWSIQSIGEQLGLENAGVRSFAEEDNGKILVGTLNGLYETSTALKKAVIVFRGNTNRMVIVGNSYWYGNSDGLFQYIKPTKNTPEKIINYVSDPEMPEFSISSNVIKSLFVDRTGILWIGTNGGGVNKFDPDKKQFKHLHKTTDKNSLSNNKVRSIFEDSNGVFWIGTEGGGLNMLKDKNGKLATNDFVNFPGSDRVFDIMESKRGNTKKMIFGGESSARMRMVDISNSEKIDISKSVRMKDVTKSVFSLLEDSHENLWIGTYNGGVHRWLKSESTEEYKKDVISNIIGDTLSLSNDIIRDIVEDSTGAIWFATGDGLCMLPKSEILKKKPKFIVYKNTGKNKNEISHNYVLTVFESNNKTIWIGTLGGGLNKFLPGVKGAKGTFKNYNEIDGLPNNVIKAILEDDKGNLWLSTNKGLSKFDPVKEVFKNYDVNDGLQSNEFSELACFKRKNGEMIFGGVNGLTSFFPDQIKDNETPPETMFTNFSIFNKPVAIGAEFNGRVILNESISSVKNIDLEYSENSFSFEFASLHFASSRKNKYAFKLEGFDADWVYTTSENRIATYTNLEPGEYKLMVKSSNNDGVWDETPAEITIQVIPPFWRTNYAYIFYLLLFFGSLIAFRRFTVINTAKKHQLELEHFEKEKNEEVNRIKLEFFTNISHEFRTPLTLIKGPLEYLQRQGDKIGSEKVREQYYLMHKNTDYLMRLVNQLLDFRKLDRGKMNLLVGEGNFVDFIRELGEPFQFWSQKKSIHFKINAAVTTLNCWFDTDAMEKIMNNLLSNAFKFTPANGTISIDVIDGKDFIHPKGKEIKDVNECLIIQVKDTGAGIPEHRIKHVFERFYVEVGKDRMKNPEGTGIGLSFTKDLVELHKGGIDLISVVGEGTTFIVWIPKDKKCYEGIPGISFYEGEENKSFISQIDAESHAIGVFDEIVDQNISKSRSKQPVLLIVDDNADIRAFVKLGLSNSYTIYEAENGQQGFEMALKVSPNIIITDVLMPIMDGIEFCDKLKSTQETSHIPVVMLTAKTSQEWEIEGLKNGADEYIRKPFDMELLELKLTNILKYPKLQV